MCGVGLCGGLARYRGGTPWMAPPEQQQQGQTEHKAHAHDPEYVIVRQHHRLTSYRTRQEFERAVLCYPRRQATVGQAPGEPIEELGGPHVVWREMIDQAGAVKGRAVGN